jgi:hypothetical protein
MLTYDQIETLVAQLETLAPSDLTASLIARVNTVIERKAHIAAQAEALRIEFSRELVAAGYMIHAHSWSSDDYVHVVSQEMVMYKPAMENEEMETHAAMITARWVDDHWQVVKMYRCNA